MTWLDSGHQELRAGIRSDMQVLINQLDAKLSNRIDGLDEKLSNRIAALDEKLSERIHQVELRVAESKADLMRWSFVFCVGAVAAVAALAGVLRGL